MRKALLCATLFAFLAPLAGAQTVSVELANMREDVRLLQQKVGDLSMRIEQLERENAALRGQAAGAASSYATVAQLNDAVADLSASIKTSAAATKNETLQQVSVQLEALGRQTNAALDSVARNQAARTPVATPTFSDNFPQEGVSYTVEKGDTLSSIAKKTGARVQDIINANKIVDPTKIRVGDTLFIPGGK